MTPLEILKREHAVILRMLQNAERTVELMWKEDRINAREVGEIVLLATCVVRCHHVKEERYLFQLMDRCGVRMENDLIPVLHRDHVVCRELLARLSRALESFRLGDGNDGMDAVDELLTRLIYLMKEHIQLEEGVLFPLAEQFLCAEDKRRLVESFARVEMEVLGGGLPEKYCLLPKNLAHSHVS